MRRVSILGSTGSVGVNAVDLISRSPDQYDVVALTGHANITLLAQQAIALRADIAVTADPKNLAALNDALQGSGVEATAGPEALIEAASRQTDWALNAIVGAAGLPPGLAAARHTKVLALANKESLVCAGPLLRQVCAEAGTLLLPVDSEHSALFQALRGEDPARVERLILTASGGPFRGWTAEQLASVTPQQAVAHPNWDMGTRISIDSASLFNKGMELIETKELFQVDAEVIEVLVHPQSIVHSLVGFVDGSVMAQLGPPDMRGAIGFALNYPDRLPLPVERIDLAALSRLEFEHPDVERFPALQLAREVCDIGGYAGCVFNAAKEVALDRFVDGSIGFISMANLVSHVLDQMSAEIGLGSGMYLETILEYDAKARKVAQSWQTNC